MYLATIVFFGAGIGGVLRHLVNLGAARLLGVGFPWGTLTVNVVGSFVMGVLAGYFAFRADQPGMQEWRFFLATGILGGFTTFSTFSLDLAVLYERGALGTAALYGVTSVAVAVLALFLGLFLVRTFAG
ncbi:fluoride efflux transporter CrcB [Kaistia dalseonensis]|uniref:Fluoride-specific ion channel FluC n=1 Tax=Kaistia dalseonensis TaxID=410840 RepID=A0ABU0H138_9HYPH|nr:fluoride efflux transporter CrcB [Kaistia dalseonensis]MCX5493448.1 fluoride efflux transporter CrcB [Kaistia dalseonensis]MDQ0436007.1 CrcB protein [Kaistia dalseonensis]